MNIGKAAKAVITSARMCHVSVNEVNYQYNIIVPTVQPFASPSGSDAGSPRRYRWFPHHKDP